MNNSINSSYHLNSKDKELISILMENTDTSLAFISEKIGSSTSFICQRIKKLKQAGVIGESNLLLNYEKLGYGIISYIGVFLDHSKRYFNVINFLREINEVVEAHYVTGKYTVFLKVICLDNNDLIRVIDDIQKFKGVVRIETFISLEQTINRQLKI